MGELEKIIKQMREAGYTDAQIQEFVASHEQQAAAPPVAAPRDATANPAPQAPPPITGRDLAGAALQGATLGYGNELGLTRQPEIDAFAKNHPVASALAKGVGASGLPVLAATAFPALATGAGALAMGGAVGGIMASGEAQPGQRLAAVPGGVATGVAGSALAAGLTAGGGRVLSRFMPSRDVARGARQLAGQGTLDRMAAIEEVAPGGSSLATATVPKGSSTSRFVQMAKELRSNPAAAASAEKALVQQKRALEDGLASLGQQLDKLRGVRGAEQQTRALVEQFNLLEDELKAVDKLLPVAQNALGVGAATTAMREPAKHGTGRLSMVINKVLQNKKGAAKSIARDVLSPSTPAQAAQFLNRGNSPLGNVVKAGLLSGMPPALQGLLAYPEEQR